MTGDIVLNIAVVLGVILVSMTLHEVMHGFMAYWLGDDTARLDGRLTLNPIKHIDPIMTILIPIVLAIIPGAPIFGAAKPVPFNPNRIRHEEWGVALVGLAGPLTNLVLAFIIYGLGVVLGLGLTASVGSEAPIVLHMIFIYGVIVNLGFFIFNMIPIPPLDGSRVLYAFAPDFARRGMEIIEQYGIFFIFAFVMLANSVVGQFMFGARDAILQVFMTIFAV